MTQQFSPIVTQLIQDKLALAAVRSRAGLAGRVQHILTIRTAQPRMGIRWLAALSALTVGLASIVGLAQEKPRPVEPPAVVDSPDVELPSIRDAQSPRAGSEETPTAQGREAHFQLRRGRVAYVPFNEFTSKVRGLFEAKAHKLRTANEITESYGPLADFTVRYTLARVNVPWEEAVRSGQGGNYLQLKEFHFYPVRADIGETVSDAMGKGSLFRRKLAECDPRHYTITFWIYPDNTDDFNQLKKELLELGYSVTARPVVEGHRIGGAANNSKSNAE